MIGSTRIPVPENRICPENEHWTACNRCHENHCEYSAGCNGYYKDTCAITNQCVCDNGFARHRGKIRKFPVKTENETLQNVTNDSKSSLFCKIVFLKIKVQMESAFLKMIVESLLLVDVRKTNIGYHVVTAANENVNSPPELMVLQIGMQVL